MRSRSSAPWEEPGSGLLDSPTVMSLLVVLAGGALAACLAVGVFCFELGGPRRLIGHLEGLPGAVTLDGSAFGNARRWHGAECIHGHEWVAPAHGDQGERRIRLMWAPWRERDTAADLLSWDLEQFLENDNHHEGGEELAVEVSPTTACKSGRMDGELFVTLEVCRDDCVPVCIELQERAVQHPGCTRGDEACLRRSACQEAFTRYGARLARLNARLGTAVGEPGMCR